MPGVLTLKVSFEKSCDGMEHTVGHLLAVNTVQGAELGQKHHVKIYHTVFITRRKRSSAFSQGNFIRELPSKDNVDRSTGIWNRVYFQPFSRLYSAQAC